jgi:hypothetical protein
MTLEIRPLATYLPNRVREGELPDMDDQNTASNTPRERATTEAILDKHATKIKGDTQDNPGHTWNSPLGFQDPVQPASTCFYRHCFLLQDVIDLQATEGA